MFSQTAGSDLLRLQKTELGSAETHLFGVLRYKESQNRKAGKHEHAVQSMLTLDDSMLLA